MTTTTTTTTKTATLQLQQHQHHDNYNYKYNYNNKQLLRYTTLHPAAVSEVTAATIATTPKSTTPTTFRSISGFALPSVSHNNQPFL